MLFETHVDRNVEWVGLITNNVIDEAGTHEAQVEERWEDELALDELRSIDSSTEGEDNGKKKEKYPQFNMHTDMVEPQFKVGMLFGTSKIFKDAARQHAIKTRKAIKFVKNDNLRVKASCKPPCKVSKSQVYRAKRKAQELFEGSHEEQYAKLWDYCEEIRKSNPGSTIIMQVHEIQPKDEDEDDIGKSRFERIYVYLGASKKGFIAGCRPYIGVDACHLRGPYKGQLLQFVAIDGNKNTFPMAFAVVKGETKSSWK
ncbi:hypothetical protein ACSBR1_039339 [Camellia fascicularis]